VGWQTKADGSGKTYAPGKTFPMGEANVTLYALWAGGYAYAANSNQGGAGTVSQYTIGPNGALTPMFTPTVPTQGNNSQGIAVDPLGKYVYVSNVSSNTVSQFAIGPDGALALMSTPTILMGPVDSGQLYYPEGMAVSGKYAYVALQEASRVNQYAIGTDGMLSALTPATVISGDATNGRNAPSSVAIHPSGNWAYVANGGSNTVSQFTIGADGTLSALTPPWVATGGNSSAGNAADIKVVSIPSGEYAYVPNYSDGTISQFKIDATSGTLSPLTPAMVTPIPGGKLALSIAVDPQGRFAYVPVNYTQSQVIAQFKIDQTTGALVSNGTVSAGKAFAARMTIEASGKYAYATSGDTGYGSNSIAQYTIDQTTGALTLMNNPSVLAGFGPTGIVTVRK